MKLKKSLFLLPFVLPVIAVPLTSCKESNFSDLSLGASIQNNMKQARVFANNFAFFGGDDVSYTNYDLYDNNGYRNQVELFEDYTRVSSPYKLESDVTKLKYIYGKRVMFDVTSPGYTIKNAVDMFDNVTKSYDILTTIYNVDTKDVNDIDVNDFKNYLKTFIDKSLSLRNDTGMVIIKNHYQTNNDSFNNKNQLISNAIQETIAKNYWNNPKKLSRINVVNHAEMSSKKTIISPTEKFVDLCINENGTLNQYGQLELFNQSIQSLYPDAVDPLTRNLAGSYINYSQPTHSLSSGNSYVVVDEAQKDKVTNFQSYLKGLNSAKWYFFGDSLTSASYNTKGYKSYVDYLRYLIRNEHNRKSDVFINGGVYGGTYTGEFSFMNVLFTKYKLDVFHVMMGTNDLLSYTSDSTGQNAATYIQTNIQKAYEEYKKINPNGWFIISSIPNYYFQTSSINNLKASVAKSNEALKNFAQDKADVLYIDSTSSIDRVIQSDIGNTTTNSALMQQLFAADNIHYNTNGYIIITKQLLSGLGFDYSKSKFLDF